MSGKPGANLPDDLPLLERLDRIDSRINAVEAHVNEHRQSNACDVAAIDEKVSGRVAALEKALVDQSAIVTALSQRAIESETNVQRLIAAVERLLGERTNPSPATPRGPSFLELPLQTQSKDAQPFESGFRPRIVKEDDDRQKRHRRPMTRL